MRWVDFAKGLTIIFVVYRHSLVGLNRSGYTVPQGLYMIQEFVLNFRMPVFFILSGIFISKALIKRSTSTVLKNKAFTLLYPYLLWCLIFVTLQILLSEYTNSNRSINDYAYIVTQPRNLDHMWYLLALFNVSALYLLVNKLMPGRQMLHISFALVIHFLTPLVADISLLSDVFYHYIFFCIGSVLSERLFRMQDEPTVYYLKRLLLLLPLFVAGQLVYLSTKTSDALTNGYLLVIILIACLFFYFLCRTLHQAGILSGLAYIGKYSLYIYILHLIIISAIRIVSGLIFDELNIYVLILTSLVLGVSLPVVFYNLTRHLGSHYLFSLEPRKSLKYE